MNNYNNVMTAIPDKPCPSPPAKHLKATEFRRSPRQFSSSLPVETLANHILNTDTLNKVK